MWLFPLVAARRSRRVELQKPEPVPSPSGASSYHGGSSMGPPRRCVASPATAFGGAAGPCPMAARQNPAAAEAAAEIYAFLATLPVDVNSSTLGPGLVPTRTEGRLFVGTLLHALDERLLVSLGIRIVVTAAWPFGSWPHRQREIYRKLGIRHYLHPLLDDPSQARPSPKMNTPNKGPPSPP